jgi:hypothetical protein
MILTKFAFLWLHHDGKHKLTCLSLSLPLTTSL